MDYKAVVVEAKEFEIPKFIKRDLDIDIDDNDLIYTITGGRKNGKTYLCFQMIDKLLKKGINKNNILYINFETNKLLNCTADDLDKILETYFILYTPNTKQKLYLFLDEIQNVRNWDSWVRKIYDTKKNIKIIITGSNSKLLSKEISTRLRGNTITFEIYPISFKEYLRWKGYNIHKIDMKTITKSDKKNKILKLFIDYLTKGGYPKIVLGEKYPQKLLNTYYNVMIFKDIAERYNIRNIKQLKILASLVIESVSGEFSYTKLKNSMNSLGFKISTSTVIEYINLFEEAYLFFQNIKYEYAVKKQLGSIKKIYCIDNGLLNNLSFSFSEDWGKLLENIAYIELKRRQKDVWSRNS